MNSGPHVFPDDLRSFVNDAPWTDARTMLDWPHEYLVRERVDRDLFARTVLHIRSNGYEGRFYHTKITCYDEASFVYWTMGAALDETTIISRCRKEDSFESRLRSGTLPTTKTPHVR